MRGVRRCKREKRRREKCDVAANGASTATSTRKGWKAKFKRAQVYQSAHQKRLSHACCFSSQSSREPNAAVHGIKECVANSRNVHKTTFCQSEVPRERLSLSLSLSLSRSLFLSQPGCLSNKLCVWALDGLAGYPRPFGPRKGNYTIMLRFFLLISHKKNWRIRTPSSFPRRTGIKLFFVRKLFF